MTVLMRTARQALACLLLTPVLANAAGGDRARFASLLWSDSMLERSVAAALGERLYTDPRLSARGDLSCASCHGPAARPDAGGRDPTSLLNVSLNSRFGWTGRFSRLEDQVEHELLADERLAGAPGRLRELLASDEDYRAAVSAWLGRVPQAADVAAALSAYLRTRLTPDAPFDRYLAGQAGLPADAEAGLRRFGELGCSSCHQGVNLGGNLLVRIGLFTPYDGDDPGRAQDTGRAADKHVFRVPGLRNVADSAPYFHDGSRRTLAEAIRSMGRMQLARELSGDDVAQLSAFLQTLSAPLASNGSRLVKP